MSYTITIWRAYGRRGRKRPAREGLGYDFTIGTPWDDITISLPVEKLAEDVGMMAVKAGFPVALTELKSAMPDLMKQAATLARPYVRREVDLAVAKAKTAGAQYVGEAKSTAGIITGALILAVVGAAFLVARKK